MAVAADVAPEHSDQRDSLAHHAVTAAALSVMTPSAPERLNLCQPSASSTVHTSTNRPCAWAAATYSAVIRLCRISTRSASFVSDSGSAGLADDDSELGWGPRGA